MVQWDGANTQAAAEGESMSDLSDLLEWVRDKRVRANAHGSDDPEERLLWTGEATGYFLVAQEIEQRLAAQAQPQKEMISNVATHSPVYLHSVR